MGVSETFVIRSKSGVRTPTEYIAKHDRWNDGGVAIKPHSQICPNLTNETLSTPAMVIVKENSLLRLTGFVTVSIKPEEADNHIHT